MRLTMLGLPQGVQRHRNNPRRHSLRPALEGLEERSLLSGGHQLHSLALPASRNGFLQTNLVSDQPGVAMLQDPNLVNSWAIAFSPSSPFWITDNGTGMATIYLDPAGTITPGPFSVTIPLPAGSSSSMATPTGIVFNGTTDFGVSGAATPGLSPSVFIFAAEDGTISAWTPRVDQTHAILEVDNSGAGAVYKGLAMASNHGANYLYATNFGAGTVDVFDASFHQVSLKANAFHDRALPRDYAPFGIQNVGGLLYVTYAKQNAEHHDDVAGLGHGVVDVYKADGTLLKRLIRHGQLDSPWGMAIAPATFGAFAGDLLVGNFGNGRINAYNPATGQFRGQLKNPSGHPITIPGLWGLAFGNGGKAGDPKVLYFASGPGDEKHGLFGSLTAVGRSK